MSESLATVSYIGATILFILSLGGLSNPESSTARQPLRHDRHDHRRAGDGLRAPRHGGRHSVDHRLHGGGRQHRALRRPHRENDPDAGTGCADAQPGRSRGHAGRIRELHRSGGVVPFDGGGKGHPRDRDLHRHPDRCGDLLRLDHRLRQALGQDRRQADAPARASLDEPRGPADYHLLRAGISARRLGERRHDRADRDDRDRAAVRHPHGDGDRRRRHAGGDFDAEQLLRLGGGGDRLHAVERPLDRHRRAGGLERRHPLLHHVPGDEPPLHQRDRGRIRHRGRYAGGGRRRRSRPARSCRSLPRRRRNCCARPRT